MGSSMISTRALKWIARAIATACRWPPESELTSACSEGSRSFMRASVALRRVLHRLVLEEAEPAGDLAPQEQVGGGVQIVGQRQVLVDRLDAQGPGVARRADLDRLAVEPGSRRCRR